MSSPVVTVLAEGAHYDTATAMTAAVKASSAKTNKAYKIKSTQ
jgi:hypothetical protein